jgi:hypothetical protein
MITAIPLYDKDHNEIGIEDIIDLPSRPVNPLKDEQIRILTALSGDRSEPAAISSRKKRRLLPKQRVKPGALVPLTNLFSCSIRK